MVNTPYVKSVLLFVTAFCYWTQQATDQQMLAFGNISMHTWAVPEGVMSVQVVSPVDLQVSNTANEANPNVGEQVTFTIEAYNNDFLAATAVQVTNELGTGLQYLSHDVPVGTSFNPTTGIWDISGLSAGQSLTMTITATVQTSGVYFSFSSIAGNEEDVHRANNESIAILSPNGGDVEVCDIQGLVPVFVETFGAGADKYGPALPAGTTNLEYYRPPNPPVWRQDGTFLSDGRYVLAHTPKEAFDPWQDVGDHTGDANGYFMAINAYEVPNEFFRQTIAGLCPNTRYRVSFWAMNVNSPEDLSHCAGQSGGYIYADIAFFAQSNINATILGAGTTGQLPYSYPAQWIEYSFVFTTGADDSSVDFVLFNTAPGGCGNDLGIDDITVFTCSTEGITIGGPTEICEGDEVTISSVLPPSFWPGVEYQWQYSTDNGTWVDLAGATDEALVISDFQAPNVGYYRLIYAQTGNMATPTCRFVTDVLDYTVLNVLPVVDEIDGPNTVCLDGSAVFTNTTAGGIWTSSDEAVVPIDEHGLVTGLAVGNATISYTVTTTGGCATMVIKEIIVRRCSFISNPMIRQRVIK